MRRTVNTVDLFCGAARCVARRLSGTREEIKR